jgi:hypothetical protein
MSTGVTMNAGCSLFISRVLVLRIFSLQAPFRWFVHSRPCHTRSFIKWRDTGRFTLRYLIVILQRFIHSGRGESKVVIRLSEFECPLESPPAEGEWPVVVRLLLSSKRWPHFKARGSRGPKPRITVLARTNSNLTDRTEGSSFSFHTHLYLLGSYFLFIH